MGLIFRPASKEASRMRPQAAKLAASLPGARGVKSQIMDGFILRAVGDGKNVTVYVIEPPAILGLSVCANTADNSNTGDIYTYDFMLDAVAPLQIGVRTLVNPSPEATPIALTARHSGATTRTVTIDGAARRSTDFWRSSYQFPYGRVMRSYDTPSALLTVYFKHRYPENNNPWKEPVMLVNRLFAGGSGVGSESYGMADDLNKFGSIEIDVYSLGFDPSTPQWVHGATEWGPAKGAVLWGQTDYHLVKYSVTQTPDAESPLPIGHIDWHDPIDLRMYLSGPFSAEAGTRGGDETFWVLGTKYLPSEDPTLHPRSNMLYRYSPSGERTEIELSSYTINELEEIGVGNSNIYVEAVLAASVPQLRFVAVNHNANLQQISLCIYTEAGTRMDVGIGDMYPVNEYFVGPGHDFTSFYTPITRQRAPICQYAPGYAAVLVSPNQASVPNAATMQSLHIALVNVDTGVLVGISPELATYRLYSGLCLSTVEQGIVEDGEIVAHAKMLLSIVDIYGQYRPTFAPLTPTNIYMVSGIERADLVATVPHPANAYYLGSALNPAKIGVTTNVRGLLQ